MQRLAQIVTGGGEKPGARTGRLLGLQHCVAQAFFRLFALGRVDDGGLQRRFALPDHHAFLAFKPDYLAVPARRPAFVLPRIPQAMLQGVLDIAHRVAVLRDNQVGDIVQGARVRGAFETVNPRPGVVDEKRDAVAVDDNAVDRSFREFTKPLLACFQGLQPRRPFRVAAGHPPEQAIAVRGNPQNQQSDQCADETLDIAHLLGQFQPLAESDSPLFLRLLFQAVHDCDYIRLGPVDAANATAGIGKIARREQGQQFPRLAVHLGDQFLDLVDQARPFLPTGCQWI